MNDKKKNIEKALIFMVVGLFILLGFIVYQRYTNDVKEEKEEVIIDNYYNSEYLFNNDYIKIANTVEDFNNKNLDLYMYLDGENTFYIKNKDSLKETNVKVTGLPKGDIKLYYNYLGVNCYEFAGLLETDLYYANFCLDASKTFSFEKISTTTSEVYIPSVFKPGIFVIDNEDITSNFIINTTLNKIKYISSQDNILGLYDDVEEVKPYFNYICFDRNSSICKQTMYYITFDNELVLNYDVDKIIKTDTGDNLIIQDLFGIFEINSKKEVNLENVTYNDFTSKYEYIFKLYVLDKENNFYVIEMNNNSVLNKSESVALSASKVKVKTITYNKDEDGKVDNILISYENGKSDTLVNSMNKYIVTSTMYDKNSK